MNNLDWLAIFVLALFWFFGVAPMIFGGRFDSYKDSLAISTLAHFAVVLLFLITGALFWSLNRVMGMI